MICIKNKDKKKLNHQYDLAKEFKNELTKEVNSIARVLDITHRGGIDEIVEAGNFVYLCKMVQDRQVYV